MLINPLERVDYDNDGRFGPKMFDYIDAEIPSSIYKYVAKSHGYEIHTNIVDLTDIISEELFEYFFSEVFIQLDPPELLYNGSVLVGAWDNEDGEIVLVYAREIEPTWKPIETAPQDGREILACMKDYDSNVVVYYEQHHEFPDHVWNILDKKTIYHKDAFSHWMELPPQPRRYNNV